MLRQEVYDPEMAELDQRFGGRGQATNGDLAGLGDDQDQDAASAITPYETDDFAARHSRIQNEFENYLEDKSLVD